LFNDHVIKGLLHGKIKKTYLSPMPIIMHQTIWPSGEIGIWEIEEPEAFFLEQLRLHPAEIEQVERMKGRRKLEWLAGRYLLHKMSGRKVRGICLKDANGKPRLEGSNYQISISHSHNRAAVIAAPNEVGVDIQFIVSKIERIAHKFMRTEETESLHPDFRIEHLHVYWGAKECLYKAYGRKRLDFREHLHIQPFTYSPDGGSMEGDVIKGEHHSRHHIVYRQDENYILVYSRRIGDALIR
jgi:4'-phosphopantetheinyl transferase